MMNRDLEYKQIKALKAIVQHQSFELAAQELNISQSAVSQRLKSLEEEYGEPLISRQLPYSPSNTGEKLLSHLQKVELLEEDFNRELESLDLPKLISIAVNQDSLEGWLLPLFDSKYASHQGRIEIINDDQDITLKYLKEGVVAACVSSQNPKLKGVESIKLGTMTYSIVCTPEFNKKYFGSGVTQYALENSPSILFNRDDNLHTQLLESKFNISPGNLNCSYIPSVNGFYQATLNGLGYSCLQNSLIDRDMKKGHLELVHAKLVYKLPLYLHYFNVPSASLKSLIQDIEKVANLHLR